MRVYQIGTCVGIGLALVLGFQNCAKQGTIESSNSTAADSVEMQKTLTQLKSQITSVSARDLSCASDADCLAVAVGGAACGGPSFFVVNSSRNADYANVLQLAAQFKDVERNYQRANQVVGTCAIRQAPPTACRQNLCVNATAL